MTATTISDVTNQIQTYWAPLFAKELRESTLWLNFIKYHYEFAPSVNGTKAPIKGGNTLKISTITAPVSTSRTIGTDADSFDTNKLSMTQTNLVVDKRAVSAVEFDDLSVIMSQLEDQDSEIRQAMLFDIRRQVNVAIKAIINPSASAPDHVINGVTDFNFAQLAAVRLLESQAKWTDSGEQISLIIDPSYTSDLIDETLISSNDYNGGDTPVASGAFRAPKLGMNVYEDNSLSTDYGYALIPSWAIGAFGVPEFKISDLHAQKRFGYVMSVDQVFGVIQHDNKRIIKIYNS